MFSVLKKTSDFISSLATLFVLSGILGLVKTFSFFSKTQKFKSTAKHINNTGT